MSKLEKVLYFITFALLITLLFCEVEMESMTNKLNDSNKKYESLQNEYELKCIELENAENELDNLSSEYNVLLGTYCNTVYDVMQYIEPIKESNKMAYFICYKTIVNESNYVLDPSETIYDYYSDEEIDIMLRCIETETYDCPFEAKVNVANVILNRVDHELFPSDAYSVVTAPNQFAYGRKNITEETILALEYAFEIEDTTNGCVGFRSDKNPSTWNGWEYVFTDGYHYFYRMKGE